jgi:hypothetical protein
MFPPFAAVAPPAHSRETECCLPLAQSVRPAHPEQVWR